MEEVDDIRCFQHCDARKNILCFTVPLSCPLCGADLTQSRLRIPPYLLNSPFTDAVYNQYSLVIKPTVGHFLYNFDNYSNLHIGLTDSNGRVFEFDERGVTEGGANWTYCLSIPILQADDEVTDKWDQSIKQSMCDPQWKFEWYDEHLHNCYDFVLYILRKIGLDRQYPCILDKSKFCEQMIIPVTVRAGKYISLYQQINTHSVVIQNA